MTSLNRSFLTVEAANSFTTDATEQGWAQGFVPPQVIDTDLGNHRRLVQQSSDGDCWRYAQLSSPVVVVVFNS